MLTGILHVEEERKQLGIWIIFLHSSLNFDRMGKKSVKTLKYLNNTLKTMELPYSYRTLHSKATQYILF